MTAINAISPTYSQPYLNPVVFNPTLKVELQSKPLQSMKLVEPNSVQKIVQNVSAAEQSSLDSLNRAGFKYGYLSGEDPYGNQVALDKAKFNYVALIPPKNSGKAHTLFILGNGNINTVTTNPNNIYAEMTSGGDLILTKMLSPGVEFSQTIPGGKLSFDRGIPLKFVDVVTKGNRKTPILSFF